MGLFSQIATPLVTKGVPVIPLRPKTKIAFLNEWEKLATTDMKKVLEWDIDFDGANAACVAYARENGVWFLEIDKSGFADRIERETGQKMPATMMVRSSPGRGHYYFKQTPASIAMGNAQGMEDGKEAWSARVDNRYVVAPGSYHPTSGLQYELLNDAPIAEAPDWLVGWCAKSRIDLASKKTGHIELDSEEPIAEGGRNSTLTRILGKARQVLAMDRDQLFEYGMSVNAKRCNPPLSEQEVRTIANSIGGYAVQQTGQLILGSPQQAPTEEIKPIEVPLVPYPVFPRWVMDGTSIGEGLCKPVCAKNSRYPEFMFIPAMTIVLNYLGQKVNIVDRRLSMGMYVVCIGRRGVVIKSSSVNDAVEYLKIAGVADQGNPAIRNAQGRSLVWQIGSPEGLGLEMTRTNNRNAVLFYDELSTMIKKASIEKSTLKDALLQMYDSNKFANTIKSRKETYSFDPHTYTASLIACTTDKKFLGQWSTVSSEDDGFNDRFFFLYQPEVLNELTPQRVVNTVEGSIQTKKLIEKAVQQVNYRIVDETPLEMNIGRLGNRTENRVEKMALFFAVDLGRDEIDEDCVDRALAIANYELAVKEYLNTFESITLEGQIQQEIIQALQRNAGVLVKRKLERTLHSTRYGTTIWNKAYAGLINSGWIAENGNGKKNDPTQVVLQRLQEKDENN